MFIWQIRLLMMGGKVPGLSVNQYLTALSKRSWKIWRVVRENCFKSLSIGVAIRESWFNEIICKESERWDYKWSSIVWSFRLVQTILFEKMACHCGKKSQWLPTSQFSFVPHDLSFGHMCLDQCGHLKQDQFNFMHVSRSNWIPS